MLQALQRLIQEARHYAALREEDARLATVATLTRLLAGIVLAVVALVCVCFALTLLSVAAAVALSHLVGGLAPSFLLLSILYLLLLLIIYKKREAWIINPICKAIAHAILSEEGENTRPQ